MNNLSEWLRGEATSGGETWNARMIAAAAKLERLTGDLNIARLRLNARVCTECPAKDALSRLQTSINAVNGDYIVMRQRAENAESEYATQCARVAAIREHNVTLTAENAALRIDLDRLTHGSWSKELARLSAENAALREAIEPFVRIVKDSSGRIPTERLSLENWHSLTNVYASSKALETTK